MRKSIVILSAAFCFVAMAKADPACPTATLSYYLTNFAGSAQSDGCAIGAFTFQDFGTQGGGGIASSGGLVTSAFGPTGSDISDFSEIVIVPIENSDGTGFEVIPTSSNNGTTSAVVTSYTAQAVSVGPGSVSDMQFSFVVEQAASGTPYILTNMYNEVDGTAGTPGGQDVLTESFCTDGLTLPPSCDPSNSPALTELLPGETDESTNTSFASDPLYSLAVEKDIGVEGNQGGEGTATLSSVTEQFGPAVAPVPEPSSLLLLGTGLLAGARFMRRRLTRKTKA